MTWIEHAAAATYSCPNIKLGAEQKCTESTSRRDAAAATYDHPTMTLLSGMAVKVEADAQQQISTIGVTSILALSVRSSVGQYTVKCSSKTMADAYGFRATASGVGDTSWCVRRRYSEFDRLRSALVKRGLRLRCPGAPDAFKRSAKALLSGNVTKFYINVPGIGTLSNDAVSPATALALGIDKFPAKGFRSCEPWVMAHRQRSLEAWLSAALSVASSDEPTGKNQEVLVEVKPVYWQLLSHFLRPPADVGEVPPETFAAGVMASSAVSSHSSAESQSERASYSSADTNSTAGSSSGWDDESVNGKQDHCLPCPQLVRGCGDITSPATPDGAARKERKHRSVEKKRRKARRLAVQGNVGGKHWLSEGNRFISNDAL